MKFKKLNQFLTFSFIFASFFFAACGGGKNTGLFTGTPTPTEFPISTNPPNTTPPPAAAACSDLSVNEDNNVSTSVTFKVTAKIANLPSLSSLSVSSDDSAFTKERDFAFVDSLTGKIDFTGKVSKSTIVYLKVNGKTLCQKSVIVALSCVINVPNNFNPSVNQSFSLTVNAYNGSAPYSFTNPVAGVGATTNNVTQSNIGSNIAQYNLRYNSSGPRVVNLKVTSNGETVNCLSGKIIVGSPEFEFALNNPSSSVLNGCNFDFENSPAMGETYLNAKEGHLIPIIPVLSGGVGPFKVYLNFPNAEKIVPAANSNLPYQITYLTSSIYAYDISMGIIDTSDGTAVFCLSKIGVANNSGIYVKEYKYRLHYLNNNTTFSSLLNTFDTAPPFVSLSTMLDDTLYSTNLPLIPYDLSTTNPIFSLPAPAPPILINAYANQIISKIWIPVAGLYEFGILADDAALLKIDGIEVARQNSNPPGTTQTNGTINITTAGFHTFTINYINSMVTGSLSTFWKKPGDINFGSIHSNLYLP